MADEALEAAKKRLAEEREFLERSRVEFAERARGKPTPTQEENDLAALGAHLQEKEDDGSGGGAPAKHETRQLESRRAGGYQTRSTRAATGATGSHQG